MDVPLLGTSITMALGSTFVYLGAVLYTSAQIPASHLADQPPTWAWACLGSTPRLPKSLKSNPGSSLIQPGLLGSMDPSLCRRPECGKRNEEGKEQTGPSHPAAEMLTRTAPSCGSHFQNSLTWPPRALGKTPGGGEGSPKTDFSICS